MSAKIPYEEVLRRCNTRHNFKFGYEKLQFEKIVDYVVIICPEHGEFEQKLMSHLIGHNGCKECRKIRLKELPKRSQEEYIQLCKAKHNNFFNYSKTIYKGAHQKIIIICPEHGEFEQFANDHFKGSKCPSCSNLKRYNLQTIKQAFINRYGNEKYDYSLITKYKNNKTLVPIRCIEHNHIFWMKSNDHLNGHGCHICNFSSGENKIKEFLIQNNIRFMTQIKFSDCINPNTNYQLIFDFCILNEQDEILSLIEYDGQFHFMPILCGGRGNKITKDEAIQRLKDQQYRDELKNQYCKNKNIKLIRINFVEFEDIKNILIRELHLERKDNE